MPPAEAFQSDPCLPAVVEASKQQKHKDIVNKTEKPKKIEELKKLVVAVKKSNLKCNKGLNAIGPVQAVQTIGTNGPRLTSVME